jgi:hypothetical protein
MAGIETSHSQDVDATLSGDLAALSQRWTDDAVRLQQREKGRYRKHAIRAASERPP